MKENKIMFWIGIIIIVVTAIILVTVKADLGIFPMLMGLIGISIIVASKYNPLQTRKNKKSRNDKIRLTAILILGLLVIAAGILYSVTTFMKGDSLGAIVGAIIAISILAFALFAFKKGNRDLKEGFPLKDERSKRVMEKATYKAFLVSLYLLLAIGFLSDDIIRFRDVSQAMSVSVGGMALLFLIFWIYYNKKNI